MARTIDSAKRVINGTFGEVWLDGDKVSECYGLQAKVSFNKEDIALCGQMASDKKVTSIECTGSLRMHKVTSRMALAISSQWAGPTFVLSRFMSWTASTRHRLPRLGT